MFKKISNWIPDILRQIRQAYCGQAQDSGMIPPSLKLRKDTARGRRRWVWFVVFGVWLLGLALVGGGFYLFAKVLAWLGLAFGVGVVGREWILKFLILAALVNGLVGIMQVIKQHDLGLYMLGESKLLVTDKKVALAYLNPGFIMRAYGLMPHPNVLGGLVFLGIMATLYFLIKRELDSRFPPSYKAPDGHGRGNDPPSLEATEGRGRMYWGLWLVWGVLWVALILTFSRSAWLATVVGLGFVYFNFKKNNELDPGSRFRIKLQQGTALPPDYRRVRDDGEWEVIRLERFKKLILITGGLIFVFLGWAIWPRFNTLDANNFTVVERASDFKVFWSNISNYGFFGTGLKLKIQEPLYHSLYLMMFKEGGLTLPLVFLILIYFLFKERLRSSDWRFVVLLAMLLGLLVIGLFDHYLWTIRQGVGMLFLSLGLLI